MNGTVSFIMSNIGELVENLFTVLAFGMVSKSFAVFSCSRYLLQ